MRKSQKNIIFLIIFTAFISFQLFPIIGLGDKKTVYQSDFLSNNLNSVFDNELRESLLKLGENSLIEEDNSKIILLFEDGISKEFRNELIQSVFQEYVIIDNYDLIPGIYIKVSSAELSSNQELLDTLKVIKKIYKPQVYENPYIIEDSMQINSLNVESYSNWWVAAVGAENLPYDGSGVRVAVIDTGIYDHPALNIVENQNFVTNENVSNYNDDVGHGTHVAGIIGGDGTGSDGKFRGIAPGVSLINARAGNASGLEEGDIISAIEWSSKPIGLGGAGADIVSMSFGGGFPYISDLITEAITSAQDSYGVIFVASAGNSGPEYFTGSTPAAGIDVISVGASDINNNLASFSSWGPTFGYLGYPDVVAPGVNIISTEAKGSDISKEERLTGNVFDFAGDGDYIPLSGTSMSAPVVSGALAILKEAYPNITAETARIALIEGAEKLISEHDGEIVKSGAGLINISASLNYLNQISPDYNDTAKVFPNVLPIEPFDLIKFPGDRQKFNVTVISGKANTYDIESPVNIPGITLKLDKPSISFSNSGIGFIEFDIEVNKDAVPGGRDIQLNLTIGATLYDTIDIHLDIELPEYRILMESFHGLNDWFPDFSFSQLGFYEAMSDIHEMNISIDYSMEYWTPDYDRNNGSSILTEEKLAQYDLVFLQTPILPYSPLEVNNLKNYFDNGGNLLFFGTRYQDMVLDNINNLFAQLGLDILISEENIMNDNWLGISTTVSSQSITNLNNPIIFDNVTRFQWLYGNSFTVSNNTESIATKDGKTVVALYNGSQHGKGNFLAFGDFHWAYNSYSSQIYSQDHVSLLKNSLEYLLSGENVSINIDVGSERTSSSLINISVYIKDQITEVPLTTLDYDNLSVIIENGAFSEEIFLNTSLSNNGIYFNYSYNLPAPSYDPYIITINLTISSNSIIKHSKLLYYDSSKVPKINSLVANVPSITRANGQTVDLIVNLDKPSYGNFEAYLSIYSFSFFNTKKSVNKTLSFSHLIGNNYRDVFDPLTSDPSGYAVFYVMPSSDNYTNPNSPRITFQIENNPPEILKASSFFNYGSNPDITFDETEENDQSFVYSVTQGSIFNFFIDVQDTVSYEDSNSNMRVFINMFMASVNNDSFLIFILPRTLIVTELMYQSFSDVYEGIFILPNSLDYNTLEGIKTVSTAANFDTTTNQGYLGILYITVFDSEGGIDEFLIILYILGTPPDFSSFMFIIIGIVAVVGIVSMIIYYAVRRKRPRVTLTEPRYQDYYYQTAIETPEEEYITPEPVDHTGTSIYCPFCGYYVRTPKKFCPNCGESLMFNVDKE
ncbi:MAG: S8 family serine peptidase [Candidatus Thorarchaeota archaeon]